MLMEMVIIIKMIMVVITILTGSVTMTAIMQGSVHTGVIGGAGMGGLLQHGEVE